MTPQSVLQRAGIRVTADEPVVWVRIPGAVTVDDLVGRAINHRYMDVARNPDIAGAITVFESDAAVTDRGMKELEDGVAAGLALGLERWAVVCLDPELTRQITPHIVGIEHRTFETEAAARDWLTTALPAARH